MDIILSLENQISTVHCPKVLKYYPSGGTNTNEYCPFINTLPFSWIDNFML